MRDEFSAVRTEMAVGFAEVRGEISVKTDGPDAKTDSLATQMRVLHEDVIARIVRVAGGAVGPIEAGTEEDVDQRYEAGALNRLGSISCLHGLCVPCGAALRQRVVRCSRGLSR